MREPVHHLHESYRSSFCGKDATHLPMTYDPREATCGACLKAKKSAAQPKASASLDGHHERELENPLKADEPDC